MVAWLDSLISAVGPAAFLVLAIAAAVEYVFPPFPGDTVVLLGGIYAARGQKPWALVLLVITLGSVVGAAVNYAIGRWIEARLERRLERRTFLGISLEQLLAVEQRMRRRGFLLLLVNRFIPGIRALFFVAAGMASMPLWRVLALGAVSQLAHGALLIGAGMALGGNAERLEELAERFEGATLAFAGVVAVGLVLRAIARRRRAAAVK